jgi:hypothetical protein
MDNPTPHTEGEPSPGSTATDDLRTPPKRARTISHRRTLAGIPLALAGILVVSSVAFAATVVRTVAWPADTIPVAGAADNLGTSQTPAPQVTPTADPTARPTEPGHRATTAPPVAAPSASAGLSCSDSVADLGLLAATDNIDRTLGFSWAAYSGGTFTGYELVYETTSSGKAPSVPDGSPTWASPAPADTSASVSGVGPGDYQVRLQAIVDVGGVACVVAQTNTIHVHLSVGRLATPAAPTAPAATPVSGSAVADLGPLGATDNIDFTLGFSWNAYTGGSFAGYRLEFELSDSGKTPSFLDGSPTWASPAPGTTSVRVAGVGPGNYQVRLQAIAFKDGAAYVCGQTSVIHVHLSAARVPPSQSPSAPTPALGAAA